MSKREHFIFDPHTRSYFFLKNVLVNNQPIVVWENQDGERRAFIPTNFNQLGEPLPRRITYKPQSGDVLLLDGDPYRLVITQTPSYTGTETKYFWENDKGIRRQFIHDTETIEQSFGDVIAGYAGQRSEQRDANARQAVVLLINRIDNTFLELEAFVSRLKNYSDQSAFPLFPDFDRVLPTLNQIHEIFRQYRSDIEG